LNFGKVTQFQNEVCYVVLVRCYARSNNMTLDIKEVLSSEF